MPRSNPYLRLLNWYGRRRQRARLWFSARTIEAYRAMTPGSGELSDDECDLLGQLAELPHYAVFLKYLAVEKRSVVDNGLPTAKDVLELGEVKGNISRMNKLEYDISLFFEAMDERRRAKEQKSDLAREPQQEQDGDIL